MKNLAIIFLFISSTALALPLPKINRDLVQVPKSFTSGYNFEGIVELNNCSGALIRFDTTKETDFAVVMTNGHCVELDMPKPGVIIFNRPTSRVMKILNASGDTAASVDAKEIIYATMTKTDVTLYRLNETYADLLYKYDLHPLTLSRSKPLKQMGIEIISGYWHRGYTCNIEEFAHRLKEDVWTFEDSIRYSRPGCETIGGTSGAPIVQTGTRTVVGINNTGNEDGDECTMNNPCEVDPSGGVIFKKGYSYGQETYWIYSCLDSKNQIDLKIQGCLLPK